jgi:hypothetical protein
VASYLCSRRSIARSIVLCICPFSQPTYKSETCLAKLCIQRKRRGVYRPRLQIHKETLPSISALYFLAQFFLPSQSKHCQHNHIGRQHPSPILERELHADEQARTITKQQESSPCTRVSQSAVVTTALSENVPAQLLMSSCAKYRAPSTPRTNPIRLAPINCRTLNTPASRTPVTVPPPVPELRTTKKRASSTRRTRTSDGGSVFLATPPAG